MSCKQDREYREQDGERDWVAEGAGRRVNKNKCEEYDERDGKKDGRYGCKNGITRL